MIEVFEIIKPTPKFTLRGSARIGMIVIHDTAGSMPGCLEWLQIDRSTGDDDVSVHLLIDRLGNVYRLVPDEYAAWHCRGYNSKSLGIELERGKDDELGEYSYNQLEMCARATARWCRQYSIPIDKIFAHRELSNYRRDPRNFPWQDFLRRVADLIIADRLGVLQ
jgi:N-acetyl-anhydromuramyl-L-alanine amidase AmpD